MIDIFLPTLLTFANDNIFTGSCGKLRFKISPSVVKATPKEVDYEQSSIRCEIWYGEKCYELSDIEQERTFPMSEEGRSEMKAWLESLA
ncbi:MAG: hypothetical protein E7467_07075 [Ruminococcaceae bacterium]|nr:hypothetical protein [Oscillospiraceae bacterium]